MRTAGLPMSDVWAHRVLRERGVETERFEALEADIGVHVETVELAHRGKEANYRPYLHIAGELRSVTPKRALPHGISKVVYGPGEGEKISAFYEFDHEQLVRLTEKGYFNAGFAVPANITRIDWDLSTTVDALVLAPSGHDAGDGQPDAPVVFLQVQGRDGMEIDLSSSGYDLATYFADYSAEGVRPVEATFDKHEMKSRSDAINSLFSDAELDVIEQHAQQSAAKDSPAAPEPDTVGTRLKAVEAEIEADRARFEESRVQVDGTPERLYAERVAKVLRDGDDPAPVPPADVDLDLDTGQEQTRAPRRAAAARNRVEEEQGHGARRSLDSEWEAEDGDSDLDLGA